MDKFEWTSFGHRENFGFDEFSICHRTHDIDMSAYMLLCIYFMDTLSDFNAYSLYFFSHIVVKICFRGNVEAVTCL